MLLSEAINNGSQLRGESHDGPFVRIANTEEIRSDVWGAACEAVHSPIAKRNWNKSDKLSYDTDIEALREIQEKYFGPYFKMPATCPGAQSRIYSQAGGRYTGRVIHGLNEVAIEHERQRSLGPITSACQSVTNLAEFIEHAFYVHNWLREECARACAWYEQQSAIQVVQNFEHFQDVSVQQRVNHRLTVAARERERQRHARRQVIFN
jgi:hypothetical protein